MDLVSFIAGDLEADSNTASDSDIKEKACSFRPNSDL